MINNTEQAVARGYESRSWLCMLRPHGQGRHHIASCGHKRTYLFWIVQRIISPCSLHFQRYTAFQRCLSKSQWLAAPVNVITYWSWDHASASHPTISALAWVWECSAETLSNSKRPWKVASMWAKSRIRLSLGKIESQGNADRKAERSPCCRSWRKWRMPNCLPDPCSIPSFLCSVRIDLKWKML